MEALYKIRLEIDGLIQLQFNRVNISRINNKEYSMNWRLDTSLRLAKAWTTKIIKILNPEENSLDILDVKALGSYENITNIQFNLLSVIDGVTPYSYKSILEKIDFLIQEIDTLINQLPSYQYWKDNIMSTIDYMNMTIDIKLPDWSLERDQIYIHLTEAKMFLGFELLNLK